MPALGCRLLLFALQTVHGVEREHRKLGRYTLSG